MPAAGWYEDPSDPSQLRYWEGSRWTEHQRPKVPEEAPSPVALSPAAEPRDEITEASVAHTVGAVVADRTIDYLHTAPWCRACGMPLNDASADSCARCGESLASEVTQRDRVGVVYEVKAVLRSRLGVCIEDRGSEIVVHLDAKTDKVIAESEGLPRVSDVAAEDLTPAGRLVMARKQAESGAIKAKWDLDRLSQLADSLLAGHVAHRRVLFDEALERDWFDTLNAVELSGTEKAWRLAHHSSTAGDLDRMQLALRELPDSGYSARAGLILPHISEIASSPDFARWIDVIRRFPPDTPGLNLLQGGLASDTAGWDALHASVEELARLDTDIGISSARLDAARSSDDVPNLSMEGATRWKALAALTSSSAPVPIDSSVLFDLPLVVIDEMIERGLIPDELDFHAVPIEASNHISARLRPSALDTSQLRELDHHAELARRYFLDYNGTGLFGLPETNLAVRHYRALSRMRDGLPYDRADLHEEVRAKLDAFTESYQSILDGGPPFMPDHLLDDPTLWPALQDLALEGRLSVTVEQRRDRDRFAEWVDLHALIALIWQHEWERADELGSTLAKGLVDETMRDEALSLRAFALFQLGRMTEALEALEDAMEGIYTEALLVNTAIIASHSDPQTASTYLGRLIAEAPSLELRIAALRRSISVWQTSPDMEVYPETVAALRQVMQIPELSADDFREFVHLSSRVDPEWLAGTPPTRSEEAEKAIAHDIYVARAKVFAGKSTPAEYSKVLVAANGVRNRPTWVDSPTREWIDTNRDLLFSDFGSVMGSASAIDVFIEDAPELLNQVEYYICTAQCGAHFAWNAFENGMTLSDSAARKFFYEPLARLEVERSTLPESAVEHIDDMFHLCLYQYLVRQYLGSRQASEELVPTYNALNQRRSFDHENRHAIVRHMREILDQDQEFINTLDRIIERITKLKADPTQADRIKAVNDVVSDVRSWQNEVIRLRGSL